MFGGKEERMGEIKSTLEIALEKAEKIGRASKEELRREELIKQGRRLAARFLQESDFELSKALAEVSPEDRPLILKGAVDTFLRNIVFPRDDQDLEEIRRVLQGLVVIFATFPEVRNLAQEIENLLSLYWQHYQQLYEQFRQQFQAQAAQMEQALSQQLGAQVKVEPEMTPQFQEEWRKVKTQLEEQFRPQLEYLKSLFLKMLPA